MIHFMLEYDGIQAAHSGCELLSFSIGPFRLDRYVSLLWRGSSSFITQASFFAVNNSRFIPYGERWVDTDNPLPWSRHNKEAHEYSYLIRGESPSVLLFAGIKHRFHDGFHVWKLVLFDFRKSLCELFQIVWICEL